MQIVFGSREFYGAAPKEIILWLSPERDSKKKKVF